MKPMLHSFKDSCNHSKSTSNLSFPLLFSSFLIIVKHMKKWVYGLSMHFHSSHMCATDVPRHGHVTEAARASRQQTNTGNEWSESRSVRRCCNNNNNNSNYKKCLAAPSAVGTGSLKTKTSTSTESRPRRRHLLPNAGVCGWKPLTGPTGRRKSSRTLDSAAPTSSQARPSVWTPPAHTEMYNNYHNSRRGSCTSGCLLDDGWPTLAALAWEQK